MVADYLCGIVCWLSYIEYDTDGWTMLAYNDTYFLLIGIY